MSRRMQPLISRTYSRIKEMRNKTTQQGRIEYTVRVLWKEELTPSDSRLKKDFIEEVIFDIGF